MKTQTFLQSDLTWIYFENQLDEKGVKYEKHLLGYDTPEIHYRYREEDEQAVKFALDSALKNQARPMAESGSDYDDSPDSFKKYIGDSAMKLILIIAAVLTVAGMAYLTNMMINENRPEMSFPVILLLGMIYLLVKLMMNSRKKT